MPDQEEPLLGDWRQGDLALAPIEIPVIVLDDGEHIWDTIYAEHGVAILSQSCDIVRSVTQKQYVQIAALLPATADEIARVKRREVPSLLYLECLEGRGLIIDLEVTATVHKAVVATWERTPGCANDAERLLVGEALGRHRQRFAFPQSFNDLIQPMRKWIGEKKKKQSVLGDFARAIVEVRAVCDNWNQPGPVSFLIIVTERPEESLLAQWEKAADALAGKMTHPDYLT